MGIIDAIAALFYRIQMSKGILTFESYKKFLEALPQKKGVEKYDKYSSK